MNLESKTKRNERRLTLGVLIASSIITISGCAMSQSDDTMLQAYSTTISYTGVLAAAGAAGKYYSLRQE